METKKKQETKIFSEQKDTMRIFYIQWNGNEDALTMMHEFIRDDFQTASLKLNTKIPESVVNIHCDINGGIFKKCIGSFKLDNDIEDLEYDHFKRVIDYMIE